MSSSFNRSRTSERPTLPSIHSLDLPFMSKTSRKMSSSSSNTTPSRSPSPIFRSASPSSSTTSTSSVGRGKLRLVPCLLEDADAIIVVPAAISNNNTNTVKPIMVMGSAMQNLRSPQRPLAKGARMHPYRIVGSSSGSTSSRRSSMASMMSVSGSK